MLNPCLSPCGRNEPISDEGVANPAGRWRVYIRFAEKTPCMNRLVAAGVLLTLGGLGGYLVGIFLAYPGRAFSITSLMVGISLLALGGRGHADAGGA